MELDTWDVAAVGIKAILYAATWCAAGGVFCLLYSAALLAPINAAASVAGWGCALVWPW